MRTKISTLLVIGSIAFSSCTDLDEKYYDKILITDYGKTQNEINTIVGSAYASLRGFSDLQQGGTHAYPTCEYVFFLEECASDEACVPTRGTDWFDGGRYQDIEKHDFKPNNVMILSAWKYAFKGIATVNAVIYQVDQSQLSPEAKALAKAELRGLRAYYYYQLLDKFGAVPIVTGFEQSELPEKSSREQVYKFVEDELTDIMDQLQPAKKYGIFTQNVANSILARLYLNAEVYIQTPKWTECLAACDKISGYKLEANYFESFKTENSKSDEIILAIPYDHKVGTVGNYLASMTYHYNQKFAFSANGTYPWCGNGICAQPGIYSSFDEKDVRRQSLLIGEQINKANGAVIMMDNGNPLNYTEEIANYTNALQNEGARLHKYEVQADDQWERDNDWVLIRYSEILMMKAEASFRLGYTLNALGYVNEIRNRSGLPNMDLNALDLNALDNEWKHEFVFEGIRRTTNIRFGTFFEVWPNWIKSSTTPLFKKVYPIPADVLNLNPKLTQNPDYL